MNLSVPGTYTNLTTVLREDFQKGIDEAALVSAPIYDKIGSSGAAELYNWFEHVPGLREWHQNDTRIVRNVESKEYYVLNRRFENTISISIDEAEEKLDHYLESNTADEIGLTPEVEFWGHCSNLQAWVEHDYDTRLLHRNLSFPLLKKLTEAGDPKAKRVFKDEIALRLEENNRTVTQYLVEEDYLKYFTFEELDLLSKQNPYLSILRKLQINRRIPK